MHSWYQVVYVVNNLSAKYHTTKNRGNEANVYLTYIIDNYDYLPASVVFTHHHSNSTHIDWAFHNTSDAVQHLNLSALQERGYTALSCFNDKYCDPAALGVWNSYDDGLKGTSPSSIFGRDVSSSFAIRLRSVSLSLQLK